MGFQELKTTEVTCMSRKAFTLIELLVVIAIISLLVSILLPSLQKARDLAKSVVCMNNCRNIGIGQMQFVNEHDGMLLPAASIDRYEPSGPTVPEHDWYKELEFIMGGPAPDYDADDRPDWQECPSKQFPEMKCWTVGYGFNYSYFGHDTRNKVGYEANNTGAFSQIESVSIPAETIIIGDSRDSVTDPDFTHKYIYMSPTAWMNRVRHMNAANYLLVDGHVEPFAEELAERWLYKRTKDPADKPAGL